MSYTYQVTSIPRPSDARKTKQAPEFLQHIMNLEPGTDQCLVLEKVSAKDADTAVSRIQNLIAGYRRDESLPLLRTAVRAAADGGEGSFTVTVHRSPDAAQPMVIKKRKAKSGVTQDDGNKFQPAGQAEPKQAEPEQSPEPEQVS